jgi:ABC-2 type transport system ATP-binding protein
MSKKTVVKVDNVTKTFRIPTEASSGLKQKVINVFKGRKGYREFTSLRDVSFEVEKGDFFGIVGRNGSGKSTLLKTIANIYTPTEGAVSVTGTLVPFIELGVGFNPELTGRENVYLNGALLGFSHDEMDKMYDDIVDFAEIGSFMDEKLKNYSSGMQVRLAFSIAIRANADILVLDEVLAVGDEAFQRKCFDYFERLKLNNQTVILVTHDMSAVERFCNKAIMIEDSKIVLAGTPYEVAAAYSRSNDKHYAENQDKTDQSYDESAIGITTQDAKGKKSNIFEEGDTMQVVLKWTHDGVGSAGVSICKQSGEYVHGTNMYIDGAKLKHSNTVTYEVKLPLAEGKYFIKAGLSGKKDTDFIDFEDRGPEFIINRNKTKPRWGGNVNLEHTWK